MCVLFYIHINRRLINRSTLHTATFLCPLIGLCQILHLTSDVFPSYCMTNSDSADAFYNLSYEPLQLIQLPLASSLLLLIFLFLPAC